MEFMFKEAEIITSSPAFMLLGDQLLQFDQDLDGKKLMPFLNKDKSHKKLSFKNYLINWKINCLTRKQKKFVEEISRVFGLEN